MFHKYGLKPRLLRIIIAVYLITSIAGFYLVYVTLDYKIKDLGNKFASQYLLKEKNRITNPIQREIDLALKLVDSPILKQWALNEDDSQLKEMALAELESYRRSFHDQSYFFIIDESQNYYFNNKDNEYEDDQYQYTLDESVSEDSWYFKTMEEISDYYLNVNIDRELNKTKLWIDAIMYNDKEKIGMAGTGFTLDEFLQDFLKSDRTYITPILFDKNGMVQAYEDEDYIQLSAISNDLSSIEDKTIFDLLKLKGGEEELKKIIEELKEKEDREEVRTLTLDFEEDREQRIAALTYIPAMEWYTMILLDSSQLISIWDFSSTLIVLILSLLVLVLLIVYFINKIIINPVNRLTGFTRVISEGNYDKKIELETNNELGTLASAFNEMAATIHQHTRNLEEMVQKRTEKLTRANQKLKTKNKKIMDNLNYARYIQKSILPEAEEMEEYLEEHFVIWKPRDRVGGDFYWMKKMQNHLLIAVIDCTGHGVSGALTTMSAHSILNGITAEHGGSDPAGLLQKLNKNLKNTLNNDEDKFKIDEGLDIGLCSLDLEQDKLIFAGAKISLYYGEKGEINRIKGDRHNIGYNRSRTEYKFTNSEINTENKTFYLTSDGFLDQNGGEENKRLGRKKFTELLKNNLDKDLKTQQKIYEEKLQKFMGEKEQRDDITLLGFKF
ncbi:MAG: SpoIIE family protein phosphatase [Halanaerobiales bacterium]